ncbi:MAG: hypothetical protein WCU88_07455 [Elusimicrobiota bacterium]|jgi:hypothetical protein
MNRAAACLLAGCALACLLLPISNPDIYWHLSAARWIAEHGTVPRADWLSWSMAGKPWVDFEWLSQLLFKAAYDAGGIRGLWALKILLFSCSGGMLWICLALQGLSIRSRSLGVLVWALGISPANDLRPENFSLLFFLALLTWLESRSCAGPDERTSGLSPLAAYIACPAFFALWANLHAGFIYGFVLLAAYGLGEFLKRGSWTLLFCLPLGIIGSFAQPYGVEVYRVCFEHYQGLSTLRTHIREWGGPSLSEPWLWPFFAVAAAACGGIGARFFSAREFRAEHALLLIFFGLASARHVRSAVYTVSIGVPIAASAFRSLRPARHLRVLWIFTALASVAFFARKPAVELVRGRMQAALADSTPEDLARFLSREKGVLSRLRMANPWEWGGFLGFRLGPEMKVFVDGRYLFHGFLGPMEEALSSQEEFRSWIEGLGASLVIRKRSSMSSLVPAALKGGERTVFNRPNYLFYLPKSEWALIYWDRQALAFVRRSSVDAAWLGRREFTVFRPDDLEAAAVMVQEGYASIQRVCSEIARYEEWAGPARAEAARAWAGSLKRSAPPAAGPRPDACATR